MSTVRKPHLPAPADFSDVTAFDNSFRWWVRSRTNPKKRYLCDVSSYKGNGRCSCPDFVNHFQKFLDRGFDAKTVWEAGQLGEGLRDYQLGIDDALRCWHLCRARSRLASAFCDTLTAANAAQAQQ